MNFSEPENFPLIPNIATVIPPDLPEPLVRLLLLRMNVEEDFYRLENLFDELDNTTAFKVSPSRNSVHHVGRDCIQGFTKDVLAIQIRQTVKSIDETLPNFCENN